MTMKPVWLVSLALVAVALPDGAARTAVTAPERPASLSAFDAAEALPGAVDADA